MHQHKDSKDIKKSKERPITAASNTDGKLGTNWTATKTTK